MNTRIRRSTYGERTSFAWRLTRELHELITTAAVGAGTTTTAFVIDAAAKAAARRVSSAQKERFDSLSFGGDKVSVTLRLDGACLAEIRAAAESSGWSANRYLTFLAWRAAQP